MLYLTEQGACVAKRGERLVVEKEGKDLPEIECFKLRSPLLFGHVYVPEPLTRSKGD